MAEASPEQRPIDWRAFLESSQATAPLACLRPTFKRRLAMYLNKEIVVIPDTLCPDWSGLAELIGFDGIEISDITRKENPGREVIERWLDNHSLNPTVGNLVTHLGRLARMDILTDLGHSLLEEVKFHENRHAHFEREPPIQDNTVSSHEMEKEGSHILTIDDTLTTITIYDAFVSYEYRDLPFVRQMIQRLEGKGFKLFIPGRNNLVGTSTYELMSRIISERCRHMIVVLSNNFIQSEVCNFQSTYAFSLNPGARDKKMVPIKIEECPIPEPLRIMALCDFTHQDVIDWSWERLEGSIRRPMPNQDFIGPESWDLNLLNSSSSSSSSSRSPSLPYLQVSRPSVPEHSSHETRGGGHSHGDTGYHSGLSSGRQMTASSSRHDCSGIGTGREDSPSNVKANVSKAIKRLTNFASSPKSKKKEKRETTSL